MSAYRDKHQPIQWQSERANSETLEASETYGSESVSGAALNYLYGPHSWSEVFDDLERTQAHAETEEAYVSEWYDREK